MADLTRFLSHGEVDQRLLGKKISEKREKERLVLRQAAEQCGISYSTLSRLERGVASPDLDTLKSVIAWLDISPSSLFMGAQPIRAHLRAQKNLVSSAATALADVACIAQSEYYEPSPEPSEIPEHERQRRPYQRLRRSIRERLAVQFRETIKWSIGDPLDPFTLEVKGVQVRKIDEIPRIPSSTLARLLSSDASRWSAITLPINDSESAWLIVLNSRHTVERQRATLMEEYCHILLGHHLASLSHVEGQTFRDYNDDQEKDAYGLGTAILVPRDPLASRVRNGEPAENLARHFGVSQQLIEYRIKVTGVWYEYKFRQHVRPAE